MARLFPFRSDPDQSEGHPRVVDLEGEDADAVFSALSSTTARQIYARLEAEPGTPSDVADAVDSSIQNVRYHLENLEEAGLIEVVDTWYSSRGNEMSVYAATDGPLIVTSDESTASRLRDALSRFLGGLSVLAGASLLVQYGLVRWAESAVDSSAGTAPAGAAGTDETASETGATGETDGADEDDSSERESDDTADEFGAQRTDDERDDQTADTEGDSQTQDSDDVAADDPTSADGTDSVEAVADGGAETVEAVFATIPPGLLFFLGGLVVLSAVTIFWYWFRPSY
ncbi:ArsR/SmtB family transcription factor [Natronorubrum sulfidifaciens]|uniref:Regulatory protein ArsR n=1 Tax=Natronorubrum sulfidifaciens JCM 14089 TaxID=1230460 RepID=L9WA61_9EURY|nr:helix-turn-helix domain-containing protein [Natronorubrum sulfidifaciens]ELY45203.1 regulatory protein ArsR [Natronorubrum sulfidifaciens JCM 14089]